MQRLFVAAQPKALTKSEKVRAVVDVKVTYEEVFNLGDFDSSLNKTMQNTGPDVKQKHGICRFDHDARLHPVWIWKRRSRP